MLWKNRRQSDNVEDRRVSGGKKMVMGGGIGTIVLIILALVFKQDPTQFINLNDLTQGAGQESAAPAQELNDELSQFVKVALAETEDVWDSLLRAQGQEYPQPTLVLFRNSVQSACGSASSASGPFYCPGDKKVYIDLSFCQELRDRFKVGGDFPIAYVLAHEVGHHLQNTWGISGQVHQMRSQLSEKEYNQLSTRLELQADFLAGVWAHYADRSKKIIEDGDIQEALTAANAIGDDRLQKQSQGYVVPDAFTHGTSAQRMYWFKKGYATGDINQGNTFESKEDAHLSGSNL